MYHIYTLYVNAGLTNFAQGDAVETAYDDVFAEFGVVFFDVIADGLVGVFDEWLIQ